MLLALKVGIQTPIFFLGLWLCHHIYADKSKCAYAILDFPLSSRPRDPDAFWTQLLASLVITSSSVPLSESIILPSAVSHRVPVPGTSVSNLLAGSLVNENLHPACCLRTHSRMTHNTSSSFPYFCPLPACPWFIPTSSGWLVVSSIYFSVSVLDLC